LCSFLFDIVFCQPNGEVVVTLELLASVMFSRLLSSPMAAVRIISRSCASSWFLCLLCRSLPGLRLLSGSYFCRIMSSLTDEQRLRIVCFVIVIVSDSLYLQPHFWRYDLELRHSDLMVCLFYYHCCLLAHQFMFLLAVRFQLFILLASLSEIWSCLEFWSRIHTGLIFSILILHSIFLILLV
jgi:hypothetical protein